jgi:hypothetical protein
VGESVKKYGMPGFLGSELRAQPGAFPLRRAICGVSELVREASEWLLGIFGLIDGSWVLLNPWLVLHMVDEHILLVEIVSRVTAMFPHPSEALEDRLSCSLTYCGLFSTKSANDFLLDDGGLESDKIWQLV